MDTLTEQGFTACAPYNGAQWAIGAEGAVCLQEGTKVRVEQRTGEGANRAATVFQRLLSAGKRLLRVIEHNEAVPTRICQMPTRSTLCATNGTGNAAAFCSRAAREKRSSVKACRCTAPAEKRGEDFCKKPVDKRPTSWYNNPCRQA